MACVHAVFSDPLDDVLPAPFQDNDYDLLGVHFEALSGAPTSQPSPAGAEGEVDLLECGSFALVGACAGPTEFHKIARRLFCGKEWCSTCGRRGSTAHLRRTGRHLGRILNWHSVGYLVFTIPGQIRDRYLYPKALARAGRYVRRMLRRELGKKLVGLDRWHYTGDCKACNGRGCEECGESGLGHHWNPHLNVLMDIGWIPKPKLVYLRALWRAWLSNDSGVELDEVDIKHKFIRGNDHVSLGKKLHRIRYVMRPTMTQEVLDDWSVRTGVDGVRTWTGVRNVIVWGPRPHRAEWYRCSSHLPPGVWRWIAGHPLARSIWRLGSDHKAKCPECGAAMDWAVLLPHGRISRTWHWGRGGTAVLTEEEYSRALSRGWDGGMYL